MNSLKTLFVSAVLVSVLYGAWWAMNQPSDPVPPLEEAAAWDGTINIEPGTPMQSSSVAAGENVQLRMPSASMSPTIGLHGDNVNDQVPPPKMTMHFDMPGEASRSMSVSSSLPLQQPLSQSNNMTTVADASADSSRDAFADMSAGKYSGASTSTVAPVAIAPQRPGGKADVFPPIGQQSEDNISRDKTLQAGSDDALREFDVFMSVVRGELDRGRLLDAYRMLSRRYPDADFSSQENSQLEHLLDRLAATIVYSKHHFLEQPYRVAAGETLEQIARRYNVPHQLLAKINGFESSQQPSPGSELKVIRGPFTAEIDLERRELTLRLPDGCYAGRFPVGVGRDVPVINKDYHVYDKIETPTASPVTQTGYTSEFVASEKWIGLEGRLGIHAAATPLDIGRGDTQGGITLRERDVDDLYDILSVGSRVTVRR